VGAESIHVMTKNDFFETLLSVSFFAVLYFLLYQVHVKVLSYFDFLPMASILFIPIGDLSGIFLSLAFVVAMRRVFARRTRTN
jgi:hypothetical protein